MGKDIMCQHDGAYCALDTKTAANTHHSTFVKNPMANTNKGRPVCPGVTSDAKILTDKAATITADPNISNFNTSKYKYILTTRKHGNTKKPTKHTAPRNNKKHNHQLARHKAELARINYPDKKCLCFTLLQDDTHDLTYPDAVRAFKKFYRTAKGRFTAIAFVRAIEHKADGKIHIHTVIKFDAVPDTNRQDELKKCWEYGDVDIRRPCDYVNGAKGFTGYFTNPKTHEYMTTNRHITRFTNAQKNITKGGTWDTAPTLIHAPKGKR